jgi:glycerol-3-phosphate dehydrogenase
MSAQGRSKALTPQHHQRGACLVSSTVSRQDRLSGLPATVDLLVVGGGITGAGIALEAARGGVKVLLAEGQDFAWGTSSRSSKLVHGGLRYLKEGKPGLTLESVRERDQLMREAPGLVDPMPFLMPHYAGHKPSRPMMAAGLAVYDLMAGKRTSGFADVQEAQRCAPGIATVGLEGASTYLDATTDDARLVLRVLSEAQALGATVINYLRAEALLRDAAGEVRGARLQPEEGGTPIEVRAACVIAATGVWADQLRGQLGAPRKLRPLRGSHLLFQAWRMPLARSVALLHPDDGRPVFAYPWQGATLVGTTDLDHADLAHEPSISRAEVDYLLRAMNVQFPGLHLTDGDILSTWAGVRPVVDSGKHLRPSEESRDHIVLHEHGLFSVTGGKLTTFRRIALDTLRHARAAVPRWRPASDTTILSAPIPSPDMARLPVQARERLLGAYGRRLPDLLARTAGDELQLIPGTTTVVAELRWGAREEQVRHLDDLLLRRTRLGLTQRAGARHLLPLLEPIMRDELGWDAARWNAEVARYQDLVARCYSVPRAQANAIS